MVNRVTNLLTRNICLTTERSLVFQLNITTCTDPPVALAECADSRSALYLVSVGLDTRVRSVVAVAVGRVG